MIFYYEVKDNHVSYDSDLLYKLTFGKRDDYFKKVEDDFVNSNDPKAICDLANYCGNIADLEKLTDAIIKIGDPNWIIYLASQIEDVKQIKKCQIAITKFASFELICKFMENVKDCDIKFFRTFIYSIKNKDLIEKFENIARKFEIKEPTINW